MMKNRIIICALGALLVCFATAAVVVAGPPAGGTDAKKREFYTDQKLVTQDGREVRFYTDMLKDKVVLIHFFYTNCRTTSAMQSKVLSDLQGLLGERLGRDIFLISMTVDPAHDTPDKVKAYARVFAARKGWNFLTGKKATVDFINGRLGGYTEDPEAHPAFLLLGNVKTGHWVKVDPDTKPKALADQLQRLLLEKKGA